MPRFPCGAICLRKSNPPREDWERDYQTAPEWAYRASALFDGALRFAGRPQRVTFNDRHTVSFTVSPRDAAVLRLE